MRMKMTGNTILVTGGGTGIGRGLAEAFQKLGNTVLIAGRRQSVLRDTVKANPGMEFLSLDTSDEKSIADAAQYLDERFPKLNVVLHSAGIMKNEDLQTEDVATAKEIIGINLLGPMLLNAALMPQLLQQPSATILTVTSGLAFVPLAMTPTYCATKAAIHSYTQSLRYQLQDTNIGVTEIIPPYVQTELMGPGQKADPAAMPLNEYLAETMQLLQSNPDATEILVERVKPLRFAEKNGSIDDFMNQFNDHMVASRAKRDA